ncbi:tetratricopeptide repeat protein [Tautonia marina]|uniref:tetratricopeptide repeat protein n=1 Tax=Tautonia marina TaxID=2653855 RepID=UPI0013759BD6|nr:tetratricopeptide repeat protein [Tautonia marina]
MTCSLKAQRAREQGNADLAAELDRQAIAHFDEAIRLEPRHPGAWGGKGMAHAQLGDPGAAAEAFVEATKIEPNTPEFFRQLGLCQIELGEISAARQSTLRAVELAADPHYARNAAIEVYNFGGSIMTAAVRDRDAGRTQEEHRGYLMALAVFRLALELNPDFEEARKGESIAASCIQQSPR